jgi:hypothetical protein
MRAFGQPRDLDVDFARADRPGLVTLLLAQCDEGRDAQYWWARTVSARVAALLRLVALTEACGALSLAARCTAGDCGERYEFDLSLQAVLAAEADDAPVTAQLGPQRSATLRRPTGEDLRAWRAARPASSEAAMRMMLESLLIAGEARSEDAAALSAALAREDPLVSFAVSCACPACGAPSEVGVDLEGLALARLAARQRMLLEDVHALASRYGWTESEVLSIAPSRRARYRALIEAGR